MSGGITDLIAAMTIFLKYGDPHNPTCCEHDELFVMIDPSKVSVEDLAELDRLGFHPSDDDRTFYSFRFGSA